jgi:hypothetical protein
MRCRVGDDVDGLCGMVPGHASRDGGIVQEVAEPEGVAVQSVSIVHHKGPRLSSTYT